MGIKAEESDLVPGQKLGRAGRSPAAFFNLEAVRRGELPSANGHASGRALAKAAAAIAAGGVAPGEAEDVTSPTRIISADGLAEAHAGEVYYKLFGVMASMCINDYIYVPLFDCPLVTNPWSSPPDSLIPCAGSPCRTPGSITQAGTTSSTPVSDMSVGWG
jgi:hypothetical protein